MDELYANLLSVCSKNIGFYYKDIEYDSNRYRIFNYNLCSYEQFRQYPSALNCRGTMFNINDSEKIHLVCFPPEKFFNYEEGNGLEIHCQGRLGVQMDKLDGSLISTYIHREEIKLKSKASLISSQALQAMNLLTGKYLDEVEQIVRENKTVNFEYTSPLNQVVLFYPESKLRILSIRCHLTGETFFGNHLRQYLQEKNYLTMINHLVSFQIISNEITQQQLIKQIRQQTDGEGYVVEIINSNQSSYLVKIKTNKYLLLHHTKFNCTSSKYLFQCVINESTDDLRSLFVNEIDQLKRIHDMEERVRPIFNEMLRIVQLFYEENQNLSRKDYAIKISNDSRMKIYLSLLMNLYSGKENDYKNFAINHIKDIFGITDDQITNIDEEQ